MSITIRLSTSRVCKTDNFTRCYGTLHIILEDATLLFDIDVFFRQDPDIVLILSLSQGGRSCLYYLKWVEIYNPMGHYLHCLFDTLFHEVIAWGPISEQATYSLGMTCDNSAATHLKRVFAT